MKFLVKKLTSLIAILIIVTGIQSSTIASASTITAPKQSFRYVKSHCYDGITWMTDPDGFNYCISHYCPGWREIMVIDSKGEIVSLGCNVSSTDNVSLLSTITNGRMYEEPTDKDIFIYACCFDIGSYVSRASVTIDLGKVYNDISFIDIFYLWDLKNQARKTEVSIDGVNWVQVDNSESSGIERNICLR